MSRNGLFQMWIKISKTSEVIFRSDGHTDINRVASLKKISTFLRYYMDTQNCHKFNLLSIVSHFSGREGTMVYNLYWYPKFLLLLFTIKSLFTFIRCWLNSSIAKTFETIILCYKRDNFVSYHWGCATIYSSLPYPLRSLFTLGCYIARIILYFC